MRDKQGRVGYEVDEATNLRMMYSSEFVRHIEELAAYIMAVQGGPKVSPAARSEKRRLGGDTQ